MLNKFIKISDSVYTLALLSARPVLWPSIVLSSIASVHHLGGSVQTGALLGIVLLLAASYGFIINDIEDREIDSLNGIDRLQSLGNSDSGRMARLARLIAVVSCGLAYMVSPLTLLVETFIVYLLWVYTKKARKIFLVANILCCFVSSSPIWMPMLILNRFSTCLLFWLFTAFLLMLSREIVFDASDALGDAAGGRKTIATRCGPQLAVDIAKLIHSGALISAVVALTSGLQFTQRSGVYAAVGIILIGFLALAWRELVLLSSKHPVTDKKYVILTRIAMILSVACILMTDPLNFGG